MFNFFSFVSAVGLLGVPSEIYRFGTMYLYVAVSFLFVTPAAAFLYVPVFWNLKVSLNSIV